MKQILFIFSFFIIAVSCQNVQNEFLEFESSNPIIIGGNKTNIKLIPTNSRRNKNVAVKIFHRNEQLNNKRITSEKYQQILDLYQKLSKKDTSKTLWLDAPTLKIKYKKGEFEKDFYYQGIPDENEDFRKVTDLILESAKLEMNDID